MTRCRPVVVRQSYNRLGCLTSVQGMSGFDVRYDMYKSGGHHVVRCPIDSKGV